MLRRVISFALAAALLHGSVAAQNQQQSPSQSVARMQQVLHKAREKNKAVTVMLNKAIDNQKKFSGKVSEISDTGFSFTDRKSGKTMLVAYPDVHEVKQRGMRLAAKIAIGVGVGIALWIGIVIAVAGGLPD